MKLGVVLATFREDVRDALDQAHRCRDLGLDGVFAYDHLWPMGAPTRPAFAPFAVLAAVAQRCDGVMLGPLVARVGLVGTGHLVEQFLTLESLAPGRVIAALGTGDAKSREEMERYGLVFAPAEERRRQLGEVVERLRAEMPVWIGAGAPATNEMAWTSECTLNLWDAPTPQVAAAAARGPVTWAGPPREDLGGWLDELAAAGAQWAVFTPDVDLAALASWRDSKEVSKFR